MKITFCILVVAATTLQVYELATPLETTSLLEDSESEEIFIGGTSDLSSLETSESKESDTDANNNERDKKRPKTDLVHCPTGPELENGDNERMRKECARLLEGHQCRISCQPGFQPTTKSVKCVKEGTFGKWDTGEAFCESNRDTVCRDKHNMKVDWFVVYRFPEHATEKNDAGQKKSFKGGETYIYMSDASLSEKAEASQDFPNLEAYDESLKFGKMWRKGRGIDPQKPGNPLYNTLAPISRKETGNVKYAIYSDQYGVVNDKLSCLCYSNPNLGHVKGLVMHDGNNEGFRKGVLLVHSQPRFPGKPGDDYQFSLQHGQIFMCISFDANEKQLSTVEKYLKSLRPNMFASQDMNIKHKGKNYPTELPQHETSLGNPWVTKELKSLNKGYTFDLVSKTKAVDIYSNVLAKKYDTMFDVVTWVKGKGERFDATDEIRDVESLKYTDSTGTLEHSINQEHSKWAVSREPEEPDSKRKDIFCFSDLNRVKSQAKRGGGAICIENYEIAKAFRELIKP